MTRTVAIIATALVALGLIIATAVVMKMTALRDQREDRFAVKDCTGSGNGVTFGC